MLILISLGLSISSFYISNKYFNLTRGPVGPTGKQGIQGKQGIPGIVGRKFLSVVIPFPDLFVNKNSSGKISLLNQDLGKKSSKYDVHIRFFCRMENIPKLDQFDTFPVLDIVNEKNNPANSNMGTDYFVQAGTNSISFFNLQTIDNGKLYARFSARIYSTITIQNFSAQVIEYFN